MKTHLLLMLGIALAISGFAFRAYADILPPPQYDTFGSQPTFTFGGSGIPNDAVAVSTYKTSRYLESFGLSYTPRYDNPALTNDGAGAFTGLPGGDGANSQPGYARWNVDLYVANIDPSTSVLFSWGWIPDGGVAMGGAFSLGAPSLYQDSWNYGMSFLGGTDFDPNAPGKGFTTMTILGFEGQALDSVTTTINTSNSVPDGGTTALLLSTAFIGLIGFARKFGVGPAFKSSAATT